jgi:hypothetical protein
MGLSVTDSEKARILEVFGKDCSVDSSVWSGVRITGCSLPIRFDGTMLIGCDFIPELYVHMGFRPAHKYKEVWELEFERGRLINKKDVSEIMKAHRQKHVQILPDPSDTKKLNDWIADTFSRRKRDKS